MVDERSVSGRRLLPRGSVVWRGCDSACKAARSFIFLRSLENQTAAPAKHRACALDCRITLLHDGQRRFPCRSSLSVHLQQLSTPPPYQSHTLPPPLGSPQPEKMHYQILHSKHTRGRCRMEDKGRTHRGWQDEVYAQYSRGEGPHQPDCRVRVHSLQESAFLF